MVSPRQREPPCVARGIGDLPVPDGSSPRGVETEALRHGVGGGGRRWVSFPPLFVFVSSKYKNPVYHLCSQ